MITTKAGITSVKGDAKELCADIVMIIRKLRQSGLPISAILLSVIDGLNVQINEFKSEEEGERESERVCRMDITEKIDAVKRMLANETYGNN